MGIRGKADLDPDPRDAVGSRRGVSGPRNRTPVARVPPPPAIHHPGKPLEEGADVIAATINSWGTKNKLEAISREKSAWQKFLLVGLWRHGRADIKDSRPCSHPAYPIGGIWPLGRR